MVELGAVVAIVVVAAIVGTLVHVRAVRRAGDVEHDARASAEGLEVADLIRPLLTLVALLLAFVLVQTFSSFQNAADRSSDESGAVLAEARAAQQLPPAPAAAIVGSLRCYARAVVGPGWDALSTGRQTSPITDVANERVEQALFDAQQGETDQQAMDRVIDADLARVEARRRRLNEAEQSVPTTVTVLLVGSVAIVVGVSAALTHRRARLVYSLPVLAAILIVFAGTLVVILDLDRPFGGLAVVEPDQMRDVEQRLGELRYAAEPPCDERGVHPAR